MRYLSKIIEEDALNSQKMAFISGPRQAGKTTLAMALLQDQKRDYYSWDNVAFMKAWSKSPEEAIAKSLGHRICLDEIHKDRKWKSRLKGLYDSNKGDFEFMITGSARLDLYRKGGDSLQGRYFPYRLYPFTVSESTDPCSPDEIFQKENINFSWENLMKFSGFPEPLFDASEQRARRWSRLRQERLIREDIRDIKAVNDLQGLKLLSELLPEKVGSLLSINNLREDAGIAYTTAYMWLGALEALYNHFLIRPYHKQIKRTLKSEPKLYLFDILKIENESKRLENLTALHLLKACHFWTDTAQGEFQLHFIRTKEKEEVDFFITRDGNAFMLVECKSGESNLDATLIKFTELLKPKWSFQLTTDTSVDKFYSKYQIRICSYEKFTSGLI